MGRLSDNLHREITNRSLVLERVKQDMRQKVLASMRKLERSLLKDLASNDPTAVTRTAFQQERLRALLQQTRKTISSWATGTNAAMVSDLRTLAKKENLYLINEMNAQIGVDIATVAMSPEAVTEVVKDTLIQSAPSKDWWSRQARNVQDRFAGQVREGMLRGETTDQITRRIRGTRAKNYTDGVMAVSRREAEALVRTSVQTVANQTRIETYAGNKDVIKGLQWTSTLDMRTTEICMALHGKVWHYDAQGALIPVGHDKEFPGPTAHWNCRSTQIPVVKSWAELSDDPSAIKTGGRPTNLHRAFDRAMDDVGMTPAQKALTRFNARASMDGYEARDIGFDKWLNSQPTTVQNKMLGPGRADLFRQGKISVNDLISQRGRPLTLAELTTSPGTAQIDTITNLSVLPASPPPNIPLSAPGDKTWFIDSLYEQGGFTRQQILDMTLKQFPDADPQKTLSTIMARPSHMKKAGKIPKWIKTVDPIKLPPPPGPTPPPVPVGPPPPGSLSKTAYIDSLYDGSWTKQEILDATLKHFPGSDARKTLATINTRPSHMRKAGKIPSLKPSDKPLVLPDGTPPPVRLAPPKTDPMPPTPPDAPPIGQSRPITQRPGEAPIVNNLTPFDKGKMAANYAEWFPTFNRLVPDPVKARMHSINGLIPKKKGKCAFYRSGTKQIHMQAYKPGSSYRADATLIHETGHHFHHETGLVEWGKTNSAFNGMWKALKQAWDGERGAKIRQMISKGWVGFEQRQALSTHLGKTLPASTDALAPQLEEQFGQFMDLIEAITRGDYGYGHGKRYYRKNVYYQYAEAAAHLFSSVIQGNPYLEAFCPEAVAMMREWSGLAAAL